MSNIGNFSGVYQLVYQVAEMVDQVLLGTSDQVSVHRLGQLFIDMASEDKRNHRAQYLDMTLRRKGMVDAKKLLEVGNALTKNKVQDEERDFLEEVARILEQEQTYSLERMRGEY